VQIAPAFFVVKNLNQVSGLVYGSGYRGAHFAGIAINCL